MGFRGVYRDKECGNLLSFREFIEKKPLYYKEIDHKRVHIAYDILKDYIKRPQIVHIIGTNGKGSTGRIMATLLYHGGKRRVGHFSSPHIIEFNERIWIDGKDIDNDSLDKAHNRLYHILGQEISSALSYFEYTTLLALVAMEHLDIIILEAGLGGEFDATNVVNKDLTIVTPIGLDHQDFLGNSIYEIASTKLNSMDEVALLGIQPTKEVYNIAEGIAKLRGSRLYILEHLIDLNSKEVKDILVITEELNWGYFLYENALLAINGLKMLKLAYKIEDLRSVRLFGRFYQIAHNVIIDVGHNLLAVESISKALEERYGKERVVLIYNSLEDKDYSAILRKVKKHIKRVEIIPIDTNRALDVTLLQEELINLSIEFKMFKNVNNYENYLVFGSFFVVESFIKKDLLQI